MTNSSPTAPKYENPLFTLAYDTWMSIARDFTWQAHSALACRDLGSAEGPIFSLKRLAQIAPNDITNLTAPEEIDALLKEVEEHRATVEAEMKEAKRQAARIRRASRRDARAGY